jgi:hypothetical protein
MTASTPKPRIKRQPHVIPKTTRSTGNSNGVVGLFS